MYEKSGQLPLSLNLKQKYVFSDQTARSGTNLEMGLNSQLNPKENLLLVICRWTEFPGVQAQMDI